MARISRKGSGPGLQAFNRKFRFSGFGILTKDQVAKMPFIHELANSRQCFVGLEALVEKSDFVRGVLLAAAGDWPLASNVA